MFFKKSLLGYNKREVDEKLEEYRRILDVQKKDIEYLKKDNELLKSILESEN